VRIDIVTIFPDYLHPLGLSLVGRARAAGRLDVRVHDLRHWTRDVHRTVDDAPYGGGPGMVMRPEPWWAALEEITGGPAPRPAAGAATAPAAAGVGGAGSPGAPGSATGPEPGPGRPRIIVPTPAGRPLTQGYAADLAREDWLLFCCGRYEGIDGRVAQAWADDEISIGDYVLAGGEVASLVIVEAVTRLLPGVVGNAESVSDDSFAHGLLEAPAYTRPPVFQGRAVPAVLLSGNHGDIARWRHRESLLRTAARRPELLDGLELADDDRRLLAESAAGGPGSAAGGPGSVAGDRGSAAADTVERPAAYRDVSSG